MNAKNNMFTYSDFMAYIESILREKSRLQTEYSLNSNKYGWLQSKNLKYDKIIEIYLDSLKPVIHKLSPQSCTSVIVKFETLSQLSMSFNDLLAKLKNLLEEQEMIQILAGNFKSAKETKHGHGSNKNGFCVNDKDTISYIYK